MSKVCPYYCQAVLGLQGMLVGNVVIVQGLHQLLLLQLIVSQHWQIYGLIHFERW
jgi:hypothetical protein